MPAAKTPKDDENRLLSWSAFLPRISEYLSDNYNVDKDNKFYCKKERGRAGGRKDTTLQVHSVSESDKSHS